jgi:hypothetical protein
MYRFSMIAMAVGALALLSAGSALAAQHEGMKGVSISGSMTADLEMVSTDPDGTASTSQIGIQSEAVLDFSAASGPVSMKLRLEANDAKTTLDNVRNMIKWQVTDGFSMTISGMSFGETATLAPFGASTVGHFTQNGSSAGHRASNTMYVFGVNKSSADFRFSFSGMNAGLVLNPDFALEGGTGATETMTLSPYFFGNFGALGVYFQHSIASGTGVGGDPEASETSVAVVFKSGQMQASLQIAPGSKKTAAGAESDTNTMALGLRFGGIKFHYITEEEETSAGAKVEDNTDLAVSYTGAISEKAEWTVGYAMSDGLGGAGITGQDGSVTVLAFGLGLGF